MRVLHTVDTGTRDARKAEQMEDEVTITLMLRYGIDKVRGGHFCCIEQDLVEPQLRSRGAWERIMLAAIGRQAFTAQASWGEALDDFLDTTLRYYDAGAPSEQHDAVFSACYGL